MTKNRVDFTVSPQVATRCAVSRTIKNRKKFKDKKFAAGCSRDVIAEGAQRLGWELTDLMDRTLRAMQSCEESIRKEMEG